MKILISLFCLVPFLSTAHPGIGIVKDSKGNIYYTDLERVWKIANGKKTVIIPNVHTHELWIDKNDHLYGEGGYYDNSSEKFYHFLWVYRGNDKIDTVIGMKQAYVEHDFSLARDIEGTEYYKKDIIGRKDTNHIYKKPLQGKETVFATGSFGRVKWLHPQVDGSVLYIKDNALYRIYAAGNIKLVKDGVADTKPSFKFSENNPNTWGIWQDQSNNIYVAAFSDQAVRKIDSQGNMTDVYNSKEKEWTPLHGVFDNNNKLWVLETSDENEVRVTMANEVAVVKKESSSTKWWLYIIGGSMVAIMVYLKSKRPKRKR